MTRWCMGAAAFGSLTIGCPAEPPSLPGGQGTNTTGSPVTSGPATSIGDGVGASTTTGPASTGGASTQGGGAEGSGTTGAVGTDTSATTGLDPDPYGSCADGAVCPDGGGCIAVFTTRVNGYVCAPTCAADDDCPPPPPGGPPPTCIDGKCLLLCDMAVACPDAMACVAWDQPTCMWPK